jgi:hypothetical protein
MIQHSSNLYAANGAAVVFAEKGHFDVSKDIFTQVSVMSALFEYKRHKLLYTGVNSIIYSDRFKKLPVVVFLSRCPTFG